MQLHDFDVMTCFAWAIATIIPSSIVSDSTDLTSSPVSVSKESMTEVYSDSVSNKLALQRTARPPPPRQMNLRPNPLNLFVDGGMIAKLNRCGRSLRSDLLNNDVMRAKLSG